MTSLFRPFSCSGYNRLRVLGQHVPAISALPKSIYNRGFATEIKKVGVCGLGKKQKKFEELFFFFSTTFRKNIN